MTKRLHDQHSIKDILKHQFLKVYRMDQTEIGTIDKTHYSLKEILAKRQAFVNDKIFEIDEEDSVALEGALAVGLLKAATRLKLSFPRDYL